ncbi:hypothetical protein JRO89_XS01G0316800 [Xanthoceras sorbifolium]|uniref:Uncharacterized protein n=1 Tax=Xanthoceras sorbifolium TaxID=99658 RepID=A0ABQ8IMJ2_9ROSI|nr:hypothetical protein JRO89_XS01G0316800 [Xanthoceras sorbifolium]
MSSENWDTNPRLYKYCQIISQLYGQHSLSSPTSVEGIRGKDTNEYIAKFSMKCLLSWDDSIRRTSRVWIYLSYCDGLPSVLKCPV